MRRIAVKPLKKGRIKISRERLAGDLPPTEKFAVQPLGPKAFQELKSAWPYSFPPSIGHTTEGLTEWADKDGGLQQGMLTEYAIFWALEQLRAVFLYQSPLMGGRASEGGAVADFTISDPIPNLLIRVMGEFWHYERGEDTVMRDYLQKIQLESNGWMVIDIDGEDALRDPIYYVTLAFQGIDLSRAMRSLY